MSPAPAPLPPAERPVFVFSQRRGGSTLLLRLLNCHPELVIWGEHGGFINQLAEADLIAQSYRTVLNPKPEAEFARFLSRGPASLAEFAPWLSPVTVDDFPTACRAMIHAMFIRRVGPGQRWGFKEIRYHRPLVAKFLARLFPGGRFVLLTRDPVELCVSNILVNWSLESLLAKGVQHDAEELSRVVDDCLYAILAMQMNMAAIQRALPDRVISLTYELLTADPFAQMDRVLAFLGAAPTAEVRERMRIAAEAAAGVTNKDPGAGQPALDMGLLTAERIRQFAARALPRVAEELRGRGIDVGRLRRTNGQGRYCYLMGDVEYIERGCSSMF
jgi:hypothetical protein